ncbi:MAG: hypothetical protein M3Z09_15720 [Acidobacteriota bacterium]|nr:hypothetical protein [Acidobacteriota bacterium]
MIRWAIFFFALPCPAHMMSMSSGDALISGNTLTYTLSMPLYEIAHTAHPEDALLSHIEFRANGQVARAITGSCHRDPARDTYFCRATYEFPAPVETLDVTCTFPAVTVPNHVHLLRAETEGGKHDQAIFDYTFTHATLRFRPPTATEIGATELAGGAKQAASGLLLLLTLALAARTPRELTALTALFLAGEFLGSFLSWSPASKFLECAAALTAAYLAVEILLFPRGHRWPVALVLGFVPGLILHQFLFESGYTRLWTFTGSALATLIVVAATGFLCLRFRHYLRIPVSLLLLTTLTWFTVVLIR